MPNTAPYDANFTVPERPHVDRSLPPQATQGADRWHLLRNLAETLDEFLGQKRPILKAAAGSETVQETGAMRIASPRRLQKTLTKILVLPDLSHLTGRGPPMHTNSRRGGDTTSWS